jgi:hypothetical protein
VDSATLEEVPEARVLELHRAASAVGYAVKLRTQYLGRSLGPSTAVVASMDDTHVVLLDTADKPYSVARRLFSEWYEVD